MHDLTSKQLRLAATLALLGALGLRGASAQNATATPAAALPAAAASAPASPPPASTGRCAWGPPPLGNALWHPNWNGWGNGPQEQRFQPAWEARIDAQSMSKLHLAWAFAFPDASQANSQPAVAGGRVFVGEHTGTCTRSTREPAARIGPSMPTRRFAPRSALGAWRGDGPCLFRRSACRRVRRQCGHWHAALENAPRSAPGRDRDGEHRCLPTACCTCRCRRTRKSPARAPRMRAAPSAAALRRSTPRRGKWFGRPIPSRTLRSQRERTQTRLLAQPDRGLLL